MEGTKILSWNTTNWITVLLMVILGFTFLAFVTQGVKKLGIGASS